jgi:hypothetical protein
MGASRRPLTFTTKEPRVLSLGVMLPECKILTTELKSCNGSGCLLLILHHTDMGSTQGQLMLDTWWATSTEAKLLFFLSLFVAPRFHTNSLFRRRCYSVLIDGVVKQRLKCAGTSICCPHVLSVRDSHTSTGTV